MVNKPPDPNKAVATPDTNRTTFGSMCTNRKSPKSTFNMRSLFIDVNFRTISRREKMSYREE